MDRLFALLWYMIGLHGNRDAEEHDGQVEDEKVEIGAHGDRFAEYVERVDPSGRE